MAQDQTGNILKLSSWVITLPIYIYALIKWHQFRGHFLIRNRFPKISYILFYMMFIAQTLSLIECWLHDIDISSDTMNYHTTYIVLSLSFTISGLVLYRINLIYLKWKSLEPALALKMLNQRSSIKNKSIHILSGTPRAAISTISQLFYKKLHVVQNIYRSKLSIIIICFVSISSTILYLSHTILSHVIDTRININVLYFILWILIIASIINIKHKNVEEGIGCLYECYAILFALLIQMTLQILFPSLTVLRYTTFFVLHFEGLVILYIPLFLLVKAENTLDIELYKNEIDGKIFENHPTSPKNVINLEIVTDKDVSNSIFINKSLFQFLSKNELNHSIFSDYLRYCFASENLLFVERVSIFYKIVSKLKQKHEWSMLTMKSPAMFQNMSNDIVFSHSERPSHSFAICVLPRLPGMDTSIINLQSGENNQNMESSLTHEISTPIAASASSDPRLATINDEQDEKLKLNRFDFIYLKKIYSEYEKIIQDFLNVSDNEYSEEQYGILLCRNPLFDICQEIYDQFISCFSPSQINISSGVQKELESMLDVARQEGMAKFESYNAFLSLFDAAMVETYKLMINVYGYQFRKYVRNRYPQTEFE